MFSNRGIDDYKEFESACASDKSIFSYELLTDIDKAVQCVLHHIDQKSNIHIVVDCDVDGYTSAAEIYLYLQSLDVGLQLSYSVHQSKKHGLSEDISIPEETNLLIIPDAGSNDIEQCKKLSEMDMDILVLDHHECDQTNPYAIVVNNQICDYPNKQLSGAGVVYKFLQALDSELWEDKSSRYQDLMALGLIADNMKVTSLETRFLIDTGLKHIRNKMFKAYINAQSYSLGNNFSAKDIQFYIAPLINGVIRAGDFEEKDMMFRAFIESDEVFEYKKSKDSDPIPESIYDRVARISKNAKSRQNTLKDKSIKTIISDIERRGQHNNKIVFANVTDTLIQSLTGVVAIKIADYYKKPCVLLRKKEDTSVPVIYSGSGRNIDNSPITNLKDFLEDLKLFEFVQGHQSAFGCEIKKDNIPKAISEINERLKDVDFTPFISCDFIVNEDDLTIGLVKDICDLRNYFGIGFDEPILAVEKLCVRPDQFTLMGKENSSWKVVTDEGVAIVKFKVEEDDPLKNLMNDKTNAYITVVGRTNINNYKGILTSQLIVIDYQIEVI